jgi:hypothetical protein
MGRSHAMRGLLQHTPLPLFLLPGLSAAALGSTSREQFCSGAVHRAVRSSAYWGTLLRSGALWCMRRV